MEGSDVTRKGALLSGYTGLLERLRALRTNENGASHILLVTTID